MANHCRTMLPFRGGPLCSDLCIVQPSLAPFNNWPAGSEEAGPLTRYIIPPPALTTKEGHVHRHLSGAREANKGILGPHRQVVLPTSVQTTGSFCR